MTAKPLSEPNRKFIWHNLVFRISYKISATLLAMPGDTSSRPRALLTRTNASVSVIIPPASCKPNQGLYSVRYLEKRQCSVPPIGLAPELSFRKLFESGSVSYISRDEKLSKSINVLVRYKIVYNKKPLLWNLIRLSRGQRSEMDPDLNFEWESIGRIMILTNDAQQLSIVKKKTRNGK